MLIAKKYFVALLVLLSIAGFARADIRIHDALGRDVSLKAPAQRAYVGFYFEDFLAINGRDAYDRVVALSKQYWQIRSAQWALYRAALPRLDQIADVGSIYYNSFDFEKLLAARPDVLIAAVHQHDGLAPHLAELERRGIPVVFIDLNANSVDKHVASILAMGQVMGNQARAQRLADEYRSGIADIERRIAAAHDRPLRVYVELGNKGASEYGNSYGDDMWGGAIVAAGGTNIARGRVANPAPLSPEYVLASRPDVIFIAGGDWPAGTAGFRMGFGVEPKAVLTGLATYSQRPGWAHLPAVTHRQVHAVYHGGIRTVYDYIYLQYVAKVLHPQAFTDVDPMENLRRFYRNYLPITVDGTFMASMP